MKLLEFSGWRVALSTLGGTVLINPADGACRDYDTVIVSQMGMHEMGRHAGTSLPPYATTGAAWKARRTDDVAILRAREPACCNGWEFSWHAGQPALLVGKSPTATFMYVDGVPRQGGPVAREPVDCVLLPGDTGKWISVALGGSRGFEPGEHESRLRGFSDILNAARSPWVLGEPDAALSPRLAHAAADASPARYFQDIRAFLRGTPAASLSAHRHGGRPASMPFQPELAGDSEAPAVGWSDDEAEAEAAAAAAAATLRSLVPQGELAAHAAHWNACLQVTLVYLGGERKVWRDFTARSSGSGDGPHELANLFVRCTPGAILDISKGSKGLLSALKDGSLSCWTKLWRIDEHSRFRAPVGNHVIPTRGSLEPAHLLWHLLASLAPTEII